MLINRYLFPTVSAALVYGALLSGVSFAAPAGFDTPQGFDGPSDRASPKGFNQELLLNTVEGVHTAALDGDYVVLQGTLTETDDGLYLEDRRGERVRLENLTVQNPGLSATGGPQIQIWGRIHKNPFSLYIEVLSVGAL